MPSTRAVVGKLERFDVKLDMGVILVLSAQLVSSVDSGLLQAVSMLTEETVIHVNNFEKRNCILCSLHYGQKSRLFSRLFIGNTIT